MEEIRNAGSLDVEVIEDWHLVKGEVNTRQKYATIRVGELWPGQDLRIPVRFIVPENRKAMGFHLTGGNRLQVISSDAEPRGVDVLLLEGGVGLVQTLVQNLQSIDQAQLGSAMERKFIETLNPHYSIQYWGWPAIIMRAVTAAYAESDYFEEGKIAVSGGSKNGASPSVAIIADERITALHASVSPPWESPLRLCDRQTWDALEEYNSQDGIKRPHVFLGGTFGPIYNNQAIEAGHSWADLEELADRMSDHIFISKNLEQLNNRGVDMLFHPGTHDFVAYDLAWGGTHYPQIPVYLEANSGHGKNKDRHPQAEKDGQNKTAFLLNHFIDEVEPLLEPPSVTCTVKGLLLQVTVEFDKINNAETGRIWWIYDRPPDGSDAYLRELIPDGNWADMDQDDSRSVWTVEIPISDNVERIDFFSNHRKPVQYKGRIYSTYISSPYTRVELN
jgi:hypothetical protein